MEARDVHQQRRLAQLPGHGRVRRGGRLPRPGPEQIHLLSLTTTGYPFRIGQKQQFGGLLGWSTKIIETLMFGQAQAAIAEVRCLLRHGLFHRIDYLTEPRLYRMDNASCVQQLLTIGRSSAELNEHMSTVQKEFPNGETIRRFQPNDIKAF